MKLWVHIFLDSTNLSFILGIEIVCEEKATFGANFDEQFHLLP